MVEAPAYFPRESWLATMHEWIRHPERNSSSIRRCEVWAEESAGDDEGAGYQCRYRCVRRLLPRRTNIDRGMLQECAVYTTGQDQGRVVYTTLRTSDQATEEMDRAWLQRACTPADFPPSAESVPYYHPAVRQVRFDYQGTPHHDGDADVYGIVAVDFVPFAQDTSVHDANSRLGRTALSLLRLVHQHSYGHLARYVKRVVHDVVVPRDAYQDLYIALRNRYANALIETWAEVTDPKKHVFEDLGIAAYLMLLWRDMFPGASSTTRTQWGQPHGGFVDIGCGNGLLVHILTQEVRRTTHPGIPRLWIRCTPAQVLATLYPARRTSRRGALGCTGDGARRCAVVATRRLPDRQPCG